MKKLFQLLDNNILKILVGFLIAFIVLYPKLPSVHINHTWVYIRLEDFAIAFTTFVWLIQLIRKKVSLPLPLGWSVAFYWVIGLVSLVYCLLFVAPHLANFFPTVAALEYFRRIEYMILFFVAFSTVKNQKDVRDYLVVLGLTVTAMVTYGLGQRYYVALWHLFPSFFEKNPFCFPAFLTGNEEFAKGTPFCLADTSRVASTFGGHYDLAAYLVFVVPIFIGIFIAVKKWYIRIAAFFIVLGSLILLNLTSSRTSYAAYLIGAVAALIFWKRKWWIIPVMVVSIGVLLTFRGETLARFLKTIQPVNVVSVKPNQTLPKDLQKIIQQTKEVEENQTPEKPPPGTITLSAPAAAVPVPAQAVTTVLTDKELAALADQNLESSISTRSGAFLIQKAYALDISFTTRFQAEWPRDFAAFISYPVLGTGYSSLTLASDNDYLRALGETGALGFLSFALIFIVVGIYMKQNAKQTPSLTQALIFGFAGGTVGLMANALLIDVFEASKVAESFWIILGISVGAIALQKTESIAYLKKLAVFFTSPILISIYLLITTFVFFGNSLTNFFLADDFTWLKWAATATFSDIPKYFLNAQGFFYRPLDKTLMLFMYTFFSFQPSGYHLFNFLLIACTAIGVYVLSQKLLKSTLCSFLSSLFFLLLPMHFENMFWISSISHNLVALFMVWGVFAFIHFREKESLLRYLLVLLWGILALLSFEQAVIFPLLLLITDLFVMKRKLQKSDAKVYLPFVILDILYVVLRPFLHVVPASGDYSYSIPHIIPNVVGNLLGYTSLFILGPLSLPWYDILRLQAKPFALIVTLLILLISLGIGVYLFKKKKKIRLSISSTVWFGLLFILISLLPFLALGNIAPRYGYVASIGYVILVSYLLQFISTKYKKLFSLAKYILPIGLSIITLYVFVLQNQQENRQWQDSGKIAKKTLSILISRHPSLAPKSHLIFVNVPIRKADTWIFPVGLPDAVWFIYHDNSIMVNQVLTQKEALALRKQFIDQGDATYIFTFSQDGKISEIE